MSVERSAVLDIAHQVGGMRIVVDDRASDRFVEQPARLVEYRLSTGESRSEEE
jgi:hypothetical protein